MTRRDFVVLDATPAFQAWLDDFAEYAKSSDGDAWHGTAHLLPGPGVITMATLVRAVESYGPRNADGAAWSVVRQGLPEIPASGGSDTDPNRGSDWHNLCHSIFGNFH